MSDAPDNAALLAELQRISAQLGGGSWIARWIDRRQIAPAIIVAAMTLGASWLAWHDDIRELKRDRDEMRITLNQLTDPTGLTAKINTAITSSTQNAGEILRVERDSRERDKDLHQYIDDRMASHEKWAHKGKISLRLDDDDGLFDGWPLVLSVRR